MIPINPIFEYDINKGSLISNNGIVGTLTYSPYFTKQKHGWQLNAGTFNGEVNFLTFNFNYNFSPTGKFSYVVAADIYSNLGGYILEFINNSIVSLLVSEGFPRVFFQSSSGNCFDSRSTLNLTSLKVLRGLFVVTYNGNNSWTGFNLYYNNILQSSLIGDSTAGTPTNFTTNKIILGGYNKNCNLYYKVLLYNRTLTTTEINMLYIDYLQSPILNSPIYIPQTMLQNI